jgi:hypothetical protein
MTRAERLMTGRVAGKVLATDESKLITAHEIAPDAGATEF